MNGSCHLPGLVLLEPVVHVDTRGWFYESYSARELRGRGIETTFVQDNHSHTDHKGVIRGLHYQRPPMDQAKLVRCTAGRILDVAVDIRRGSPTYARWFGAVLSATDRKQLFIPRGFAHGFLTLEDDCEVQYKIDNYYSRDHEKGIRFDDPDIGIEWGVEAPSLSEKDGKAPYLKECDNDFVWKDRP
ncbi:MAG: dTDP-4-dehydrorhamnose 3,5-epimerase [Methanomassiliicoccales archaeon]|nr:dTDP-4-dehydrorhamnose 3,5-epimerase [Methanomassiliicoccales archaeon]